LPIINTSNNSSNPEITDSSEEEKLNQLMFQHTLKFDPGKTLTNKDNSVNYDKDKLDT